MCSKDSFVYVPGFLICVYRTKYYALYTHLSYTLFCLRLVFNTDSNNLVGYKVRERSAAAREDDDWGTVSLPSWECDCDYEQTDSSESPICVHQVVATALSGLKGPFAPVQLSPSLKQFFAFIAFGRECRSDLMYYEDEDTDVFLDDSDNTAAQPLPDVAIMSDADIIATFIGGLPDALKPQQEVDQSSDGDDMMQIEDYTSDGASAGNDPTDGSGATSFGDTTGEADVLATIHAEVEQQLSQFNAVVSCTLTDERSSISERTMFGKKLLKFLNQFTGKSGDRDPTVGGMIGALTSINSRVDRHKKQARHYGDDSTQADILISACEAITGYTRSAYAESHRQMVSYTANTGTHAMTARNNKKRRFNFPSENPR